MSGLADSADLQDAADLLAASGLRDLSVVLDARGVQGAFAIAKIAAGIAPDRLYLLASAMLAALPEGAMMDLIDDLTKSAGWPLPPFVGLSYEARAWATSASVIECKFYAWAAIERLAPADRAALIVALGGVKMKEKAA